MLRLKFTFLCPVCGLLVWRAFFPIVVTYPVWGFIITAPEAEFLGSYHALLLIHS